MYGHDLSQHVRVARHRKSAFTLRNVRQHLRPFSDLRPIAAAAARPPRRRRILDDSQDSRLLRREGDSRGWAEVRRRGAAVAVRSEPGVVVHGFSGGLRLVLAWRRRCFVDVGGGDEPAQVLGGAGPPPDLRAGLAWIVLFRSLLAGVELVSSTNKDSFLVFEWWIFTRVSVSILSTSDGLLSCLVWVVFLVNVGYSKGLLFHDLWSIISNTQATWGILLMVQNQFSWIVFWMVGIGSWNVVTLQGWAELDFFFSKRWRNHISCILDN